MIMCEEEKIKKIMELGGRVKLFPMVIIRRRGEICETILNLDEALNELDIMHRTNELMCRIDLF